MLKKDPYPNLSLFVSDFLSWNPKGERHSMEHPFFSLSKNRDMKIREYTSPDDKAKLTVMPSALGIPTIWDKDLVIYAATLIREAMNDGRLGSENQPIRIDTANFLEACVRGDGSRQRNALINTLRRLSGCLVETTIETDGKTYKEGFPLLAGYKVAVETKTGKVASLDIKVCDWIYGAIWNGTKEMLAVSRDYFRLEGGLERRLYELARKHCGKQPIWKVGIDILWQKSGSRSTLRLFRSRILGERIDDTQFAFPGFPDYRVEVHKELDQVWFRNRQKQTAEALMETLTETTGL